MRCFQLVKTVLDEIYRRMLGSDFEKDRLIRARISELSEHYGQVAKKKAVDHSSLVSRFAYIYTYVVSHANIVLQIISGSDELAALFDREKVQITSVRLDVE